MQWGPLGICCLAVAVALLFHHGVSHYFGPDDSKAKLESCVEVCYFQLSDICNHETWILVFATNGLTMLAVHYWP